MSDPNKYINTYVDYALGTVHDYLNQILQLKTELKIANDLVSERNQVISAFEQEKQKHNDDMSLVEQANANAKRWEDNFNTMKGKVAHMETLSNQCVEMKHALQEKNVEIDRLNKELERFQDYDKIVADLEEAKKKIERLTKKEEKKSSTTAPAKKDINKETTPLSVPSPKPEAPVAKPIVVDKKVIEETDDF